MCVFTDMTPMPSKRVSLTSSFVLVEDLLYYKMYFLPQPLSSSLQIIDVVNSSASSGVCGIYPHIQYTLLSLLHTATKKTSDCTGFCHKETEKELKLIIQPFDMLLIIYT